MCGARVKYPSAQSVGDFHLIIILIDSLISLLLLVQSTYTHTCMHNVCDNYVTVFYIYSMHVEYPVLTSTLYE